MVGIQVFGVVIEVVVVIDNDSLLSVDVLDDSKGIELDLVRYLVLSTNEDSVIEDLDEVLHVLLDLDLIPVDTDASVGDGEALLFVASLDLDLHDSFLEKSHVQVQVGGAVLHRVR